jgi:hypothetical protein
MPREHYNDRQRIELSIPALLLHALVSMAQFAVGSEGHIDAEADQADARAAEQALRRLTGEAMMQPFRGNTPQVEVKLLRRARRETAEVVGELDGQSAIKIAMALYYFLVELVDGGYLEVWEGSFVHEAIELLVPMMRDGFAQPDLDASAQKQARRLLQRLQARGWYRPAVMQAAE